MLNRIGKREEIASGIFQSVAQRNEFFPAIDRHEPAVFEIAGQLFCFNAKIDNVGVGPNERVERLDLGRGRSIFFPAINFDRPGLAQLDGHNPRRWVSAKEHRVLFEIHRRSRESEK